MIRTTPMPNPNTPRSAVIRFCRGCAADGDIQNCEVVDCPFHTYLKRKGQPAISQIRKKCLECMGGSASAIEECETKTCPLYIYRLGTNPKRTGIGGGGRE